MAKQANWKQEKDLGKRIRMLREEKGLKQKFFAPFGIKQSYLTAIERGVIKVPSPEMLANIAKALQLSVEKLSDGTTLALPYRKTGALQKGFCPNNDCPKLIHNRLSTGMIIPYRFSIDRILTSGEEKFEAKHCPYCGTELLTSCPKCHQPILMSDPLQTHCLHCGHGIFKPITEEDMKAKGFK